MTDKSHLCDRITVGGRGYSQQGLIRISRGTISAVELSNGHPWQLRAPQRYIVLIIVLVDSGEVPFKERGDIRCRRVLRGHRTDQHRPGGRRVRSGTGLVWTRRGTAQRWTGYYLHGARRSPRSEQAAHTRA